MTDLFSPRRVAWAIWIIEIGLAAATVVFLLLSRASLRPGDFSGPITGLSFIVAYATVGAIILARRPRHPIGWLFCLLALFMGLYSLAQEYAFFGVVIVRAPLPGLRLAGWLQAWLVYLAFPAPVALPYVLFPNGRLPSPRWRWLLGLIIFASFVSWLGASITPGPLILYRGNWEVVLPWANPTGLQSPAPAVRAIIDAAWPLAGLTYIGAIIAVAVRFLRARGDERQQLKWFVYFGLTFALAGFGSDRLPDPWSGFVGDLAVTGLAVSIPLAVGIAILRYRLYDIDRLINRTLVYALLSGALSIVYFGSVALLQPVFSGQSPLVIVASTLLIAVLFAPLRSRIQAAIDRRFHRRRYDAQRILHAFSATTRSEVNLERLSHELRAAVQQSVEPATISLWLREGPESK